MSGLSNQQQAFLMLAAFLVPALLSLSAWAALGMPTDRPALGLLFSGILGNIAAGIIVYSKEISGGQASETTTSTPASPAKTQLLIRSFPSKFKFLTAFVHDTSGMTGRHKRRSRRGMYDPAPGRRGPRKGVEPAGLRRWRLSHRRTHDPGRTTLRGPRGGGYFQGPKKRRYDPQPQRRYGRIRRYGGKVEGTLTRWGTALGFALGLGAGVYGGYQNVDAYMKAGGYGATKPDPSGATDAGQRYWNLLVGSKAGPPEIMHLVQTSGVWNPVTYLKYKFLGTDPSTGQQVSTAWMLPFWLSFGTWLATLIGLKIGRLGKLHRIMRPINKIAKGATIGTFIGALALPGCKTVQPGTVIPPPPNVVNMVQNPQTNQFTYTG